MIKTQVQLPDELYRVAKEFAKGREMSLAELVRRGLEAILLQYPGKPEKNWQLPGPFDLGLKGDPFERPEWREEANLGGGALRMVGEKKPVRYGKRTPA